MPGFNPERLALARKRRELSMSELAEAAGITTRILTDHVAGKRVPSPETVERYALALKFPESFFFRGGVRDVQTDAVSFRSMKSLIAKKRDAALAACQLALELDEWIGARFRLPSPSIPNLRGMDPEEAAVTLRIEWGIGNRPVKNIVHLLELHGVRVFSLSEKTRELDAFSFWQEGTPFCFLNTLKSVEHSRFDAAHELGHLALHRHGHTRDEEREADAFASAFLMPRDTVLATVPLAPTLQELIKCKRVWGSSVAALAHRVHKIGLASPWHYRSLCIDMSRLGYRTQEPEPILPRESSQVLQKIFAALRNEAVTKRHIAADLCIPPQDLESIVFGLVLLSVDTEGGPKTTRSAAPTLRLLK